MREKNKIILSLGADIKSRFCILRNNKMFLSEDFGNLGEPNNFSKFRNSILKLKITPDIVAFDMHPGYFSTRLAASIKSGRKVAVQHHHAHIASFLSADKINKPVIGIAFDGTGYGLDGKIWGGEFIVVSKNKFQRAAHFKYLKMPGGELAVKEPWKMAFSLVFDCIGERIFKQNLEILDLKSNDYYNILVKMIKRSINCPLTSSSGRLFDAVSSLLGVCHYVNFQAEAAIKLEKLAMQSKEKGFYEFDIAKQNDTWIIGYNKFTNNLLGDIKKATPKKDIARKFHNSMSTVIINMIGKISKESGLKDVVLSGGVFQNKILFDSVVEKIKEKGYNLIYNKNVPFNDLNICLGQAYIAMHTKF